MSDEDYIANLPEHFLDGSYHPNYVQLGDSLTAPANVTEPSKEEMNELALLEEAADQEGLAELQNEQEIY